MTDSATVNVEKILVGMCLRQGDLDAALAAGLAGPDFEDPGWRAAFDAIVRREAAGLPTDLALLVGELGTAAALPLADAAMEAPVTQDVGHYVGELKARRWAEKLARDLSALAKEAAGRRQFDPIDGLRTGLENVAMALLVAGSRPGTLDPTQLADRALAEMDTRLASFREGRPRGITTGLVKLDEFIHGWHPGRLYVLAARPSMGKTTLAVNFADTASCIARKHVAFFTIEMQSEEIWELQLSLRSRVRGARLLAGDLHDQELDRIMYAVPRMSEEFFRVNDRDGRDLESLEVECRRLKRQGKLDIVFVDHLNLMKAAGRWGTRAAELSEITGRLKALAKALDVPIVALCQINREGAKLELPSMANLRDSGSIEQDADVVLLLHRQAYYGDGDKNLLIVEKNRRGKVDRLSIGADLALAKFSNLE